MSENLDVNTKADALKIIISLYSDNCYGLFAQLGVEDNVI